MKDLSLIKKSYSKSAFEDTIDTNFNQLAQTSPQVTSTSTSSVNINQFFQDYQSLFYQIPKFGVTNSHEYLIKTSSEYIGSSLTNDNSTIQALIDEVNTLRQQNLDLQKAQGTQTLNNVQQTINSLSSQINASTPTESVNPNIITQTTTPSLLSAGSRGRQSGTNVDPRTGRTTRAQEQQ